MKKLDNKGQGLTEYLILLILIAVASIGATITLGKRIKERIQKAEETIEQNVQFPKDLGRHRW